MRRWIFRPLAVLALLTAVQAIQPTIAEADTCRIIYCCPNDQICAIQCGTMYIDFACL